MTRADRHARALAARERYVNGETLQEIADDYGVTREAARLWIRSLGPGAASASLAARRTARAAEIRRAVIDHGGDIKAAACALGVPAQSVYARLDPEERAAIGKSKNRAKLNGNGSADDEELLDEIRACARDLGRTPGARAFNRWSGKERALWVSIRFGSWSAALAAAGFEPHARPPGMGIRKFSDEDACGALRRAAALTDDGYLSYVGYGALRQPTDPCGATIRNRHRGSWKAACVAAGLWDGAVDVAAALGACASATAQEARAQEARAAIIEHGSVARAAGALGVTRATIYGRLPGGEASACAVSVGGGPLRRSDEALIAELQAYARDLGRSPGFNEFGRSPAHRRRFGSWDQALAAAGLAAHDRRRFSDEDMFDAMRRAAARTDGRLTLQGYEDLREPCDPSGAVIRKRYGWSWRAPLAAAGLVGGASGPR